MNKELLHIAAKCQQIGLIAESNPQYLALFSWRINATGKSIEHLTLRELIEINRACELEFNRNGDEPTL